MSSNDRTRQEWAIDAANYSRGYEAGLARHQEDLDRTAAQKIRADCRISLLESRIDDAVAYITNTIRINGGEPKLVDVLRQVRGILTPER